MQILDNKVFGVDYSLVEFKTFVHAYTDAEGCEHSDLYDYDGFKAFCTKTTDGAKIYSDVCKAVSDGKHYVGYGSLEDGSYFEIQWD